MLTGIEKRARGSALAMGLAVALFGCSGNAAQHDALPSQNPEAAAPAPVAAARRMTLQEQIVYCRAELAERLELDAEELSLSGATSVTWRSGALGCPEPGNQYTQALVPGTWIMMKAGKRVYRCHAARGGQPFYCPDERAEPPITGPGSD